MVARHCWSKVACDPATGVSSVGQLRRVKGYTHFETSISVLAKPLRLFDLTEALSEEG